MTHADPLSDVLVLTRARGVMSTGLRASGRWAISVEVADDLKFNAVIEGQCLILIGDAPPMVLEKGDCFLIRGPLSFVLTNDLDSSVIPAADVFADTTDGFAVLNNGGMPRVTFIGGRMNSVEGMDLLTTSLPNFLVLKSGNKGASTVHWLLKQLESEVNEDAPGKQVMCEQIMHMIFVEMIRICIAQDNLGTGWLKALSDPRIGPALHIIHSDAKKQWRLEELALKCHLSRSQFSARFKRAVGLSPLDYLLRWRMNLARHALQVPNASISRVADQVGYSSEAAFGAAFKRVFGVSPGRRGQQNEQRLRH